MKLDPRKHYVLKSFGRAWRKTGAAEPGREAQNAQKGGSPRLRHAAPPPGKRPRPKQRTRCLRPRQTKSRTAPGRGKKPFPKQANRAQQPKRCRRPCPKKAPRPSRAKKQAKRKRQNEGEAPQKSSLLAGVRQRAGSFAASFAAFARGRKQARAPKAEAPKPEISEEHLYEGHGGREASS